jgi:hypothetical protein
MKANTESLDKDKRGTPGRSSSKSNDDCSFLPTRTVGRSMGVAWTEMPREEKDETTQC